MNCALRRVFSIVFALTVAAGHPGVATAQSKLGTIKGHIRLTGQRPGNSVIRMGMDPKCSTLNAGKRTLQESVIAQADGSLANVFVRLQGAFPASPAPAGPVLLDQRGCIFVPRVAGVRAGQPLQVRNSDPLFHNVHAVSKHSNGFNVSQPGTGAVQEFRLKDEEVMLRIVCDIHRWMIAFIGVVSHPYFAVSDTAGDFTIASVPAGTHTIQVWHERYGALSQTVRVTAGATAVADFAYTGSEKPAASAVRDLVVRAN
jgi:hypothetical protein